MQRELQGPLQLGWSGIACRWGGGEQGATSEKLGACDVSWIYRVFLPLIETRSSKPCQKRDGSDRVVLDPSDAAGGGQFLPLENMDQSILEDQTIGGQSSEPFDPIRNNAKGDQGRMNCEQTLSHFFRAGAVTPCDQGRALACAAHPASLLEAESSSLPHCDESVCGNVRTEQVADAAGGQFFPLDNTNQLTLEDQMIGGQNLERALQPDLGRCEGQPWGRES